jgi:hypothetical protein
LVHRAGIVKRAFKTVAKATASWLDKIIFKKALEATGDQEFAREIVRDCALNEAEADACGELAQELGAMFGADDKMMLIGACLATVGSVGGRYAMVISHLDKKLAERKSQASKP